MAQPTRTFRADRMQRIRHRKDLTRTQLALLAGVSPETVRNAESGTRRPSARVLLALAQALGVTVAELAPKKGPLTLAELRERTGLTQRQTADVIGVSSGMVSKVEAGMYGVRRPEKWAAGYQVDEAVWWQAWEAGREARRRKLTAKQKAGKPPARGSGGRERT